MPLKLDWKSRLLAQSCIELSSIHSSSVSSISDGSSRTSGGSEIIFSSGIRGSQLALGHGLCLRERQERGVEPEVRRSVDSLGRRSLPPDLSILEEVVRLNSRRKPDVVHWKTKVGGVVAGEGVWLLWAEKY